MNLLEKTAYLLNEDISNHLNLANNVLSKHKNNIKFSAISNVCNVVKQAINNAENTKTTYDFADNSALEPELQK